MFRIVPILIGFNLLFIFQSLFAQNWKRLTTLANELPEVSGMAIVRADSIWWLNDGENTPTLYCTNHKGMLVDSLPLPLQNHDWEELCRDDQGNLYIGDFGNNQNKRRNLAIHRVDAITKQVNTLYFQYPEQTEFPPKDPSNRDFDCEAMVWQAGKIYLFTKMHYAAKEFVAHWYRLDDHTTVQTAQKLGSIVFDRQVITGAALSPDGKELALITYLFKKHGKIYLGKSYLWRYDWQAWLRGQTVLLQKRRLRGWITSRQVESVGYLDAQTILVASERNRLHKQVAKRIHIKK